MAKGKKADAASTTSKKSVASSLKSLLSTLKKKASTAVTATKRKAANIFSPKAKKKKTAHSPAADDGAASDSSISSDSDVVELISSNATKEKPAGKPKVTEEDRKELENMMCSWKSPIYSFYEPIPTVEYIETPDHRWRKYLCNRYLDSPTDRTSTGNLGKHAKICWGPEVYGMAMQLECGTIGEARTQVLKPFNASGTITASFKQAGKGKVTYMARNHTKAEIKVAIVCWLSECIRPFKIVEDCGFQCLMKTGWPELYIPSASTISRDVKIAFVRSCKKIAKFRQTSPNHHAFVAVTATIERKGKLLTFVLDVVEVAKLHNGLNLAIEFQKILHEFGIEHKILSVTCDNASNNNTMVTEMHDRIPAFNKVNRMRCFLHILNLVAKSMLKQFELPAKKETNFTDEEREVLGDLVGLSEGLMAEESATRSEEERDVDSYKIPDEDEEDEEDWVDEIELTPEEVKELQEKTLPVTRVLVKVSGQ
ncbi:hypothetical protein CVT26_001954 [Gymnopilus dilepis]|uniref:Uncharacterized protein n=1 Tax=Gymnopilus dilepis TaxID=231916 RepID=A0A409X577_9AGAR|nr:hypothetical protein CVT26_001954 [Gymnopilus dilepis]